MTRNRVLGANRTRWLIALLFLLSVTPGLAEIEDWENPTIIGINKLPSRSSSWSDLDTATALKTTYRTFDQSPWVHSLNGKWAFHWSPRPEERPLDFYLPSHDAASWSFIEVPRKWQTEGFGKLIDRN